MAFPGQERPASAYYSATVSEFRRSPHDQVLGILAASNPFDLTHEQRQAWESQIQILDDALSSIDGVLYLEFDVPRLGSRIDAVLVSGAAVFPLEFKMR